MFIICQELGLPAVSYTHLDVYKRQEESLVLCVHFVPSTGFPCTASCSQPVHMGLVLLLINTYRKMLNVHLHQLISIVGLF